LVLFFAGDLAADLPAADFALGLAFAALDCGPDGCATDGGTEIPPWRTISPNTMWRRGENTAFHYALLRKICAHHGDIVLRQTAHQFLIEVVGPGCRGAAVAFLVRGQTLVDVIFQAVVEIFTLASV